MSLRDELQEVGNRFSDIPEDIAAKMQRGHRELAASGIAEQAVNVGAQAPRFTLPAATGAQVALDDLLAAGPVVLTFYRGAWCPFCNVALHSLQEHHEAITEKGARLVAVSPQIPDESLTLAEKHALTFDVLSDIGSDVAKQYGLAFDLSDELGELYEELGFDVARTNAGHGRTLPLPATYVIDPSGTIRWAFVNTDYRLRAEPTEILAALDDLS